MRHILGTIVGAVILASSFVATTDQPASAASGSRVMYCETNAVVNDADREVWRTVIETADGDSFTADNLRMRTLPFSGQRHLAESAVVAGRPRVMDCMVRRVNGQRAAIITLMSGAEWIVFSPAVK